MQPIGAEQVFTSSPSDLETLSLHHELNNSFPRLLPSFQHSEVYEKEVSFKKKKDFFIPQFSILNKDFNHFKFLLPRASGFPLSLNRNWNGYNACLRLHKIQQLIRMLSTSVNHLRCCKCTSWDIHGACRFQSYCKTTSII